ncbi:DUF3349 domain-containing protein [Hyalangium gracile]|uniref:DUF3349 domain-containing protein n=1 Tax=Hyalangium gracile TaxID=394092 RepID=UPI001CCCC3D4|nr:DUF3349 domain-containing protein [Hyalangium gracile]
MKLNISDSDPLKPVCEVLVRAFPNGVPESLYPALLSVLCEEMSFRAVARAIDVTFGIDYITVLNDAFGTQVRNIPPAAEVQTVRERLRQSGYEELPDE